MSNTSLAPNLILQMQRLGDLILTFPLLAHLLHKEPMRPLWVVAEPMFFKGLMPLAPNVVFFPPEAAARFNNTKFNKIINLSHRQDAADIAGKLQAEAKYGYYTQDNARYINGYWQIYRASIVRNNRYNRFHWADLNCLDHFPPPEFTKLQWSLTTTNSPRKRHIGLFVGASEAEKRPTAQFWGKLAKQLIKKGLKPFFFGGQNDIQIGKDAEAEAGLKGINLCGRFDIPELAGAISSLDLFITPDTGPMHLAAWINTPVLNLSMGNVHAYETAPASAGHYILMPTSSCTGCWQCTRNHLYCHNFFHSNRIAKIAELLITNKTALQNLTLPGLALMETKRNKNGLFAMQRQDANTQNTSNTRQHIAAFWQEWFLNNQTGFNFNTSQTAAANLAQFSPQLFNKFSKAIANLELKLNISMHKNEKLPENFWQTAPPFLRPITGYLHLLLENENYTQAAWQKALKFYTNVKITLQI